MPNTISNISGFNSSLFLKDKYTVCSNVAKVDITENIKITPKISSNSVLFKKYRGIYAFGRTQNNILKIFGKS